MENNNIFITGISLLKIKLEIQLYITLFKLVLFLRAFHGAKIGYIRWKIYLTVFFYLDAF